jgi:hypothetical protein
MTGWLLVLGVLGLMIGLAGVKAWQADATEPRLSQIRKLLRKVGA